MSKEEVATTIEDQEARYQHATTVTGTRTHHRSIPQQDGRSMLLKRVSGDEQSFEVTAIKDWIDWWSTNS